MFVVTNEHNFGCLETTDMKRHEKGKKNRNKGEEGEGGEGNGVGNHVVGMKEHVKVVLGRYSYI